MNNTQPKIDPFNAEKTSLTPCSPYRNRHNLFSKTSALNLQTLTLKKSSSTPLLDLSEAPSPLSTQDFAMIESFGKNYFYAVRAFEDEVSAQYVIQSIQSSKLSHT